MGSSGHTVAVVVPAAGAGARMGHRPKPHLELEGRSLLSWALGPFLVRGDVVEVVVAVGPDAPPLGDVTDPRVRTTAGGSSRFESVARGLEALRSDASIVAVHDAARPFPPAEAIDRCIRLASEGLGAVAGVPATDTVKRASEEGLVEGTPDRSRLWYAQTPQVFPRAMLTDAVERCRADGFVPTDDAGAVEFAGGPVRMVNASPSNLKVTYPADLVVARALVAEGLV